MKIDRLRKNLMDTMAETLEEMLGFERRTAAYKRLEKLFDGLNAMVEIIDEV